MIDFSTIKEFHIGNSEVVGVSINGTSVWVKSSPQTEPDYFYIENVDSISGDVRFMFNGTPTSSTIQQVEWSKDKTNWTTVTLVADTINYVPVDEGEKVYFRNDNGKCSSGASRYLNFTSNIDTNIGGELYTLLDYTDENVPLPTYAFIHLFYFMDKLIDASDLVLRWTTLTSYCYNSMFTNCTSLTTAPVLPATALQRYCYQSMFSGCTSLTTAPVLPATALPTGCYRSMFEGCTLLNSIEVNFTSWSAATSDWVYGVSATGTFTKPSALASATGTALIPTGWTIVNK